MSLFQYIVVLKKYSEVYFEKSAKTTCIYFYSKCSTNCEIIIVLMDFYFLK